MIQKILNIAFLILPILFTHQAEARHIIGGDISYECLGNDNYRFTLKVYRDCNCQNCAYFDAQAAIGIYRCNLNGPGTSCTSLGQNSTFATVDASLGPVTQVAIPDYPCLIPPNVCVQQGVYVFTVNLPNSDESYHISYQRCCRNETISNIIAPDEQGATYSIEITPESQDLCNSSPTFNSFPPTVVCAGLPLIFDHAATDPNGNQLEYSFCPPLNGGGNILTAPEYQSCAGAAPNPACPPPYNPIFFSGGFNTSAPMGGDPVVTINAATGVITGTPTFIGQYVVGVCVTEYGPGGQVLSTVFRDFQFNVANCDPTVVADILEDEIINDQEYLITSCGDFTIDFINQSFQEQYIDFYQWQFDTLHHEFDSPLWEAHIMNSSEWSPSITFPEIGSYSGLLLLNPGTECNDTAIIHVNIFPEINADFSFVYDTCVAGPVTFTDLSTTGSCCFIDWNWNFGDGEFSDIQNPAHIYYDPGNIPVTLTVRDTNQCEDQYTQIINYFPVPAAIVIGPSSFFGCEPADIFFDNLSFPIDTSYNIVWDFGDGETSGEISPWHTYNEPGTFSVSVSFTSPLGCSTDTVFNNLIQIEPSPDAGFTYNPFSPNILDPEVNFEDESMGAAGIYWTFGDGYFSSAWNPTHVYSDTGLVLVTQIVTHESGCQDTLMQWIDIKPEVRYFLPNAFTPNHDSVNETYRGVGYLVGATDFKLAIWNRWGEMVFETNDYLHGWNGTKYNTGKQSPNGVYVVLASFVGPRGKLHEFKGIATLIR